MSYLLNFYEKLFSLGGLLLLQHLIFVSEFRLSRWGRSVYANIQKFIQFQLTANNIAVMITNVVSAVGSGDVPLDGVQV